MKCVSFISSKGGSEKTTGLISVAVAAALIENWPVLILDTDVAQKSAVMWGGRRRLQWPQVEACRLENVSHRLQRARHENCELAFIDTAGSDDPALPSLIRLSDLVVIPCRPTILDRDAVMQNVNACRQLGAPFGVLMTCVKANTRRRVEVTRAHHRRSGGVVLDAQFSDRVRYQSAIAAGLSVCEMSGAPELASESIVVWKEIRRKLEDPTLMQRRAS